MSRKVVIVGAGALGSHVLLLARNWDCELTIIDFDKVEQKNTQAQMHTRMSLRRNKAQAMAQAMQGMWGLKIKAVPHRLTRDNYEQLLSGAHLVIDCTDNIAARTCIQQFCIAEGTPLLHAALSADGKLGQVIWTELFTADEESGDGATCENGDNLPFHVLMGGLIASTAKTFLASGRKYNWQVTGSSFLRV